MPRVLHVISGLKVGGAEMALHRLITSSCDSDFEHIVIALTSNGAMKQRFEEANIKLYMLNFKSSLFLQFFRLFMLIRKIKPDIVSTWMYHADFFGGLAARLAGVRKIIWGIRRSDVSVGGIRASAIICRLCAWLSGWLPEVIICVAEAARRSHVSAGYEQKRMVVVHNGFDIESLSATEEQRLVLRNECGFDSDVVVVGSLGRFNEAKDQNNFVRAAGLVAQSFSNIMFLMVGRDLQPDNAELIAWIKQTGYERKFVLLGERSDVPVCLSAMDVFCLHSRTEGFPNVLGEAMSLGLPCVATDVGDAALLLGGSGLVVQKEDPHALAQGIEELLMLTIEERVSLGQKARQRIENEFTLPRVRERFERIYKEVLKR
ncbi:MAG: glycosyltransferase [Gammaproteobacteria bacterium]|nr:glycosyltransferase [Gammaproteobacteria bacterium]